MTDREIRAAALQAASRLVVQNFQGGGYSSPANHVMSVADAFARYITTGEIR